MASIKKEVGKAWKTYNRWRNQKIVSPALKKQVIFTREGWEHITGKDGEKVSDRKIRVILKEDKIGVVRFFSIMDKK